MPNSNRFDATMMTSPSIQAVIFDCDGTLVDSERVGNTALIECVAELGLTITLDDALEHFAGRKMADTVRIIEDWMGRPAPHDFIQTIRQRMATAFEQRLEPMDGVAELLGKLNIPFCVASNGPHEKMQISLRVTGLIDHFSGRIFSAYDCDRWKPEPDLLLHAARAMGVSPSACAVIDDHTLGIQAALAAGMHPFGFAPHDAGIHLQQAGATVFHHMADLPSVLGLDPSQ